ncbi:ribose-5-phosphate isomerase [candidate division LCP-89 bacterium B3_LCP]|uniref:Ribose-5-phosphate isomerase n=1 Tax=candidate division LCP-89 bacterium B3_LCP TaxID=2012998 RepID=A0A532UZV9_UNCL8|nr:MAG: ribose-5-phosphate isomerase [candidate division LCP-89 bacterium B3_LCP]
MRESSQYHPASQKVKRVAIGADHGGFTLKQALISRLETAGYTLFDLGTHDEQSVDYPDIALAVADHVTEGKSDRGVMIDTIGIASCIVANKVKGIRAAPCWNVDVARSARSHNDANVITFGGKILTPETAWEILEVFLSEPFSGGRHERRVRKIEAVGKT